MTKTLIPYTAKEAAEAFKEKIPFVSIKLEADKNPQDELQALAFRMMAIEMADQRGKEDAEEWGIDEFRIACQLELGDDLKRFTDREIQSAESLAYVALKHGYAKMIARHTEAERHLIEF